MKLNPQFDISTLSLYYFNESCQRCGSRYKITYENCMVPRNPISVSLKFFRSIPFVNDHSCFRCVTIMRILFKLPSHWLIKASSAVRSLFLFYFLIHSGVKFSFPKKCLPNGYYLNSLLTTFFLLPLFFLPSSSLRSLLPYKMIQCTFKGK